MRSLANNVFRIKRFTGKKNVSSGKHYHSFYELLYVYSGKMSYLIDSKINKVGQNTVVFVNKNTIHKATIYDDACKYYLIKFSDEYIDDSLKTDVGELFKKHIIKLGKDENMSLTMLLSKINYEFKNRERFYEKSIYYRFNDLLIMLIRADEETDVRTEQNSSAMELALKYINGSIENSDFSKLSLDQLATRFSMSTGHFSKKFKKEIGIGCKEYIVLKKILLAKKLIETTDISITDVAFQCGFTDSNYFSTVYKKYEDIPPSQYAKIVRTR